MAERKSADNVTTTTSSSSTTIVINELTCQLQSEFLYGSEWCAPTVVLLEDVRIRDRNVEQKVKNVLVKLSAFGTAAVVSSNLITSINSAHVLVVVNDRQGARNAYPRSILLPSKYSARLR